MKTGKRAVHSAIAVIQNAKGFISATSSCAPKGVIGAISAAINPTIVIGVTAGAANTLARTLMGLMYPLKAMMIGEQKTIAAIGAAKIVGLMRGAKSNSPAVANTESAKPGSRA